MRKIVKKRQLFNKRLVLNIILVLFMFLSIGYSTLSTNLNINGNLNVKKYYEPTLYNVLAKEAETGGLARKYTGEHHDSFTEEPSKDIYHWYASNDSQGTQVLDKNNVIFADHCWQMIRTTDTGGVKMIYNGEVENNQCLNTRGTHVGYAGSQSEALSSNYWYGTDYTYDSVNKTFKLSGITEQATWNDTTGPGLIGKYTCKETSVDSSCSAILFVESYISSVYAGVIPLNSSSNYSQFGTLQFNASYNSPAYVGYMYNAVYPYHSKQPTAVTVLTRTSMTNGTNYYYGSDVTYDTTTNKYTLTGTSQNTWTNTYSSSSELYTCKSATDTTCSTVYYIAGGANSYMYGFSMSGGNLLSYYNTNIVLGTSYTESSGTYTLDNTVTITKADWFNNYATYKNYYTCGDYTTTCTNMKYITYTNNYSYYALSTSNNYIYAKDFTYDTGTGVYTLGSDRIQTWNMTDGDKSNLSTHHYTCFNDTGECSTLSYVYYASAPLNSSHIFYIALTDGKSVEDAVSEMLYSDDVNQVNSIIKTGVDAWYKHYMLSYDDALEDTIYCNDRSQRNADTNGWNPNSGSVSTDMRFKEYNVTSDLSCTNTTDQFSVSNNSAKLTYKVGLMSSPEANILNNSNARKTDQYYWLGSPYNFDNYVAFGRIVLSTGSMNSNYAINNLRGLRPSVSLKTGTEYTSGDGSMINPYVVDTSNN